MNQCVVSVKENLEGNILMSELKEYLKILCDSDYPKFIDKYLETK